MAALICSTDRVAETDLNHPWFGHIYPWCGRFIREEPPRPAVMHATNSKKWNLILLSSLHTFLSYLLSSTSLSLFCLNSSYSHYSALPLPTDTPTIFTTNGYTIVLIQLQRHACRSEANTKGSTLIQRSFRFNQGHRTCIIYGFGERHNFGCELELCTQNSYEGNVLCFDVCFSCNWRWKYGVKFSTGIIVTEYTLKTFLTRKLHVWLHASV
jgi:hypothetical protein